MLRLISSSIVHNPMDLTRMEKKIDKYVSSHSAEGGGSNAVSAILLDMTLVRDNAHLYNVGE